MERDVEADTKEVEVTDRDLVIFEQRLAGRSVHEIAHEFRLSPREVDAAIERSCQPINQDLRLRTLGLELERFDRLTKVFYERALEGDSAAAAVTLKIAERRSAMLGLDVATANRTDPIQVAIEVAKPQTSTERIEAAIAALIAERPEQANGRDD